jgi:hypothetical protein
MPFVMTCIGCLEDNSFVTTRNGRIGITSYSVRVGDLLCVLFGGSTIQVLRKEADHYLLAGEAYVHSLINGELIQRDK